VEVEAERKVELGRIKEVFSNAKAEMLFPPVQFELDYKLRIPVKVSKGTLYVNPDFLEKSPDPYRFLLWLMRHTLCHMHYCPYDAKTAYYLQRVAYRVLRDRRLAYMAVAIFSDLQVDCIYLKNRYGETPYHLVDALKRREPLGFEKLIYAVYKEFFPDLQYKPSDEELDILGRLLAEMFRPPRSWVSKVRAVASILLRAKRQGRKKLLKEPYRSPIGFGFIPLIEDAYPDSIRRISQVLGTIEDRKEAKVFYEMWIKPRSDEKRLKKAFRKLDDKRKTREPTEETSVEHRRPGKTVAGKDLRRIRLPTELSKLLKGPASKDDDVLWRRLWYRSRAENIIIAYLASRGEVKPTWAIASYPEEWYVEDDIEVLDLEASLDEGPLIPEVTTVKWHMRSVGKGLEVYTGFVPSVLVVLDSSYSMTGVFDKAATAAFIAYLSAKWAGGNTAVINFSTKHLVAGWDAEDELKEIVLSNRFGELTIMPTHSIAELLKELREPCFIVIITDGGWQNFKPALKDLERLGGKGYKITVFYIRDWKYPDEVKMLVKSPYITLYPVEDPVRDLEGLVLSETMGIYEGKLRPLTLGAG